MSRAISRALLFLCFLWSFGVRSARGQEMEPKAYSASPVGANFIVGSYSWSTGAIIFDDTLPVSDIHADVQGLALGLGHSFNLFGKLGLATIAIPGAWADVTGKVYEQAAEVKRSGFADMRLKLSTNLVGNPAMSPREFAKAPRRMIVGASITAVAPSGQYYDTKLINIGANRWAFKPEVLLLMPYLFFLLEPVRAGWLYYLSRRY